MKKHQLWGVITACLLVTATQADEQPGIALWLGGGLEYEADYEGSDDYEAGAFGFGRLDYLVFPNGWRLGQTNDQQHGFKITPSLNFVKERSADESAELKGLPDIDSTLEIGSKATYLHPDYNLFALVRYGANGHKGGIAEVGGNLYWRPAPKLKFEFGPRLTYANDTYMDRYFSVTPEQSSRSNFTAYEADAGLKSAGIELQIFYELNKNWAVLGDIRYDQLQGNAKDSPIVQQGSDEHLVIDIGLLRRFQFDF